MFDSYLAVIKVKRRKMINKQKVNCDTNGNIIGENKNKDRERNIENERARNKKDKRKIERKKVSE